ncbi:MAG: hypothetical protein E7467_07430 [Ruminococcaceae bacterium]|nr:hypothetical protein [Oscillospiraceae bacterium]
MAAEKRNSVAAVYPTAKYRRELWRQSIRSDFLLRSSADFGS